MTSIGKATGTPNRRADIFYAKRGDAEAISVRARLTYRGDEQALARATMTEDNALLSFSFQDALVDYQRERRDRERSARYPTISSVVQPFRPVEERVD